MENKEYKEFLDKQLQLLIEEQEKSDDTAIRMALSDRIVKIILTMLTPSLY